jgi:glutathione synthase/RimK-type ligase-like ATP-grasp enzyme
MILVVGSQNDPHVERVVSHLAEKCVDYTVLDPFGPVPGSLYFDLRCNATINIGSDRSINIAEIESIWWRLKPKSCIPSHDVIALYDYYFLHREWSQLIDFIASNAVRAFSINDRNKMNIASNKIGQLPIAVECGFDIPSTIFSNDLSSIIGFMEKNPEQSYVYKPFTPYMPPSGKITYTSVVDIEFVRANEKSITAMPGIFQKYVNKSYELRVTVVGDDLFSAKIDCNSSVSSEIDWRKDIFSDIYSVAVLLEEWKNKILKLHRSLGLFFGAYDFIVDVEGNLVFLEVNPAGQWMWLEDKLKLPISARIADALIHRC